jgi:hypothetical protein
MIRILMCGSVFWFLRKQHPVELDGMRNAHIRDGAAVISYFCWLDTQVFNLTRVDVIFKRFICDILICFGT